MNSGKFLTTIDSVKNTIETDGQAGRWFLFLIFQGRIKARLINNPEVDGLYRTLARTFLKQNILYAILLICLGGSILTQKYIFVLLGVLAGVYPLIKLRAVIKETTARISVHLLSAEIKDDDLHLKTIYQISEQYARECNIPSLVDVISAFDRVFQITVVAVIIFLLFLQIFNIGLIVVMMAGSYGMVYLILNTRFVYGRLK